MFEHFAYDEECQPLTTSFADYLMPFTPLNASDIWELSADLR